MYSGAIGLRREGCAWAVGRSSNATCRALPQPSGSSPLPGILDAFIRKATAPTCGQPELGTCNAAGINWRELREACRKNPLGSCPSLFLAALLSSSPLSPKFSNTLNYFLHYGKKAAGETWASSSLQNRMLLYPE